MKIFRAYIITAVVCISLTVTAACIFIADESAKRITFGNESTVIVYSSSEKTLAENEINAMPVIKKLKDGAKKAASLAPPPISNIYWFISNLN